MPKNLGIYRENKQALGRCEQQWSAQYTAPTAKQYGYFLEEGDES